MASTYSNNLRLELIGTGDQAGTWGDTTNNNLGTLVEKAISGSVSVTVSAANTALTALNGADDQSRNMMLVLDTSTGANFAVYAPPSPKIYVIYNASSYTATVYNSTVLGNTTAAGTGIAIAAGQSLFVFTDGTNFRTINAANLTGTLAIANGGTGATTASAARTNLGSTAVGDAVFTAANAVAAQQAMDVEVGVDVQAYDAGLADIAGLAVTDGNFIVGDGANWVAESGSTARTSLGLGTLATVSPSGTGSSSNFLRGDNSWATIPENGVGVSQSWSAPSRSSGTWYQNTTGKPIMVAVSLCVQGYAYVGPSTSSYTTVFSMGSASGCGPFEQTAMSFIVPDNYYYQASVRNLLAWAELR